MAGEQDWIEVARRLEAGDRVAFLQFQRLVTGFLAQLRAYDFREEWEDLRQEVLLAVLGNLRAGRLRDPQAFLGYVKIITRNKFVDRLKRQLRMKEKESLPWDDETARAAAVVETTAEERADSAALWEAVRTLPDDQRRALEGVYGEGRTYQEASEATGMPLGTLKRRLGEGLANLRQHLRGEVDPIEAVEQTSPAGAHGE